MVLKYIDFINEGFLSKTLNRAKTGDKRMEDKITTSTGLPKLDEYLKDVEWVDLGHPTYLFAKEDFTKCISFNDFESLNILTHINKINKIK